MKVTTGLVEVTTDLVEVTTGLVEVTTDLVEATTDLVEATTDLVEATTDLVEVTSLLDLQSPPIYHFWPFQIISSLDAAARWSFGSACRPSYSRGLSSGSGQFTASANPAIDAPRRSRWA